MLIGATRTSRVLVYLYITTTLMFCQYFFIKKWATFLVALLVFIFGGAVVGYPTKLLYHIASANVAPHKFDFFNTFEANKELADL